MDKVVTLVALHVCADIIHPPATANWTLCLAAWLPAWLGVVSTKTTGSLFGTDAYWQVYFAREAS